MPPLPSRQRLFAAKFCIDPLNGFRTDALKVLRRPGGQLVQIIGCEPLRRTGEWPSCLVACRVGKIPDVIDLDRSRIEPRIPFSFQLQAQGTNRVRLPESKLAEQRSTPI